jgi:hypothetical protein
MRKWNRMLIVVLSLLPVAGVARGQASGDTLRKGFEDPPNSARPLVWWHWMNGNISKQGIQLDLEWMHCVGIAGFQNFDAALSTPQVVDKRLVYMTPEWKDAFKYAITLGDQFGMEMAIAGSPGWSESGGPWVPPSHGMKKYVWSETVVEGGKSFAGPLAHPPSVTGPFQNIALGPWEKAAAMQFYADAAVVAFPVPAGAQDAQRAQPKITSSGGEFDPALLSDSDLVKTIDLPIPQPDSAAWIQFEYPSPTTMRAVTYVTQEIGQLEGSLTGVGAPEKTLEASDDGQIFRTVAALPGGGASEHTISFAPVKARYFRVTFKPTPPPPVPSWAQGASPTSFGIDPSKPPRAYKVAELVLHTDARVNRFEEKAAFVPQHDLYQYATPPADPSSVIRSAAVIDLTSKMQPDGTLDWTPPPGQWVVLRIGYSLLGITNHPATPEATGLEVDKLDRRYVKDYFEKYLDSYKETVGPELMGKRGIQYVINDSWEAGSQNWTDNMLAQFQTLRGYDPRPWLPVLTGRIVESAEASDRFLWDFRKTIADLIANEHYGQLEATLHERGMGHYGESHEGGRAFVADGMEVKKFNEVPMSAMWTQLPGVNKVQYTANADVRESASVAHIYGQNLVAAESMTASAAAPWAWSPATLKPTADAELLNGVNRFVIHESTHQPLVDKAPGLTLGPYGQWFNRNETWAEQAKPWLDYIARSSYLLQQGHFAADVVYFYGEDSNLTAIFANKSPDVPAGYGFDYINADALIHELSVSGGQIVTGSGMTYKVLYLDPFSRHMSLPVLRAIHRLVENGAIVAGPKPTDDPSQADDQQEFTHLSNDLFGNGSGVHPVGKGIVYAGQTLREVFDTLHLTPDFDASQRAGGSDIQFVHRKLTEGDLYFIDNRSDDNISVDALFRVSGRQPELWRAETGAAEPVSFNIASGRTTIPLHLEPWETVFVVFRKPATSASQIVLAPTEEKLATIDGPWTVSFQPGRGAPASIAMSSLSDWSRSDNPGIKYFSGIGVYTKTVQASADWFRKGSQLILDLGDVKNLAVVTVNGTEIGEVWHAPYRVDVSAAIMPGANQITIKVINAWVNRLIGDLQPGAEKFTFTDVKPYKVNSPLQPSGLLGPVTVLRVAAHPANEPRASTN